MMAHGITIPIYLDTNADAAHMLKQWKRLFHYGHMLMPALCILTTSTYAYLAWTKRSQRNPLWSKYALAAAVTSAMIPFTLIFMAATNDALFDLESTTKPNASAAVLRHVEALLVRWGQLHFVRSCFPISGAVIGFKTALKEHGG